MSHTVDQHFDGRSQAVRDIYDTIVDVAREFGPVDEDPKKTSIHLNRKSAFAGIQTRRDFLILTVKATDDKQPYTAYKGLTIGMATADARTKLGSPKDKSDDQDFFEFSSRESAQVYYDAATHTVTAVMVTYTGKLDGVPAAKDIFGEDA